MLVPVWIHPSQFPESVRRELVRSLRDRKVNHKFHYDSIKQAQKWLAVHGAYSPVQQDANARAIYDRMFEAVGRILSREKALDLIGLGCGSGQKEAILLRACASFRGVRRYFPCDVSVALVLMAREAALQECPGLECRPIAVDLAGAPDLTMELDRSEGARRVVTFFGMMPNFEPAGIVPILAASLRSDDVLLMSANLVPGRDYALGVEKVLPQYANGLTEEWLMTFLKDLGIGSDDGEVRFGIEEVTGNGLRRIVANFEFARNRAIEIGSDAIEFMRGERIRLFFSYRYTPELLRECLSGYGIEIRKQWCTDEEGVFLCERSK